MSKNPLETNLKNFRKEKSKELRVPAFLIIHQSTIELIAKEKPKTLEDLKKIKGIGKRTIEKYGQEILEIISQTKTSSYESLYDSCKELLESDQYISKKDMKRILDRYHIEIQTLRSISNIDKKDIQKLFQINLDAYQFVMNILNDTDHIINAYNQTYIDKKVVSEKAYLDTILNEVDKEITLDENQRRVVLDDEDYTLVLAGAGSGKTTTIAAKVKYLVDKKGIDPKKILIVSFTNKSVDELKERINHHLKIQADISTFHKVGLNLVKQFKSYEKLNIVHEGLMFNLIKDYLNKHIYLDVVLLKELILFFGYYIDTPPPEIKEELLLYQQRNTFTSIKSDLERINQEKIDSKLNKRTTIKNEIMRSYEEVQIANFLFLNGIDYTYEKAYPYHIVGSRKLYTPDFTISSNGETYYLEHFGISESGHHSRYSYYELEQYKANIKNKIELHQTHGTKLITTYSKYNDNQDLLTHLKLALDSHKIEIKPKSPLEIYQTLVSDTSSKYFYKLIHLVMNFISNFKVSGYLESDFDTLASKTNNVRVLSFLKLVKPIYLYYQAYLAQHDATDFQDMINESTKLLEKALPEDLNQTYDYIFVDEYQDISRQRFKLTKTLAELTQAKIVAVGDDWQSIYGFAGSQIQLFTNFREEMGYANYLTIDYTYRNAQEIIDVAGAFIQKNVFQLKKSLKSPKSIKKPFVLFQYDDRMLKDGSKGIRGVIYEKAKVLEDIIEKIIKVEGLKASILVLIRYGFEVEQLHLYSQLFTYQGDKLISKKFPKVKIDIMTIHKSKGLGYDNVILLNGSDGTFGFPSQLERDPILNLVLYDDRSIEYAEERRLFYVALTRTKNRVFIMYPVSKPSEFVKELFRDYENITLHGDLDPKKSNRMIKTCPHCEYPLQFKNNKAYGLKLYMCTNEVEICGFMSNNLKGGKHTIEKCDMCKDGFLIIKESKKLNHAFLGCTNYKDDGKGCNQIRNFIEGIQ